MRQFITGNDKAFSQLEEKAKRACIRFRNQELPPGCLPDRADIGFEINSDSGNAKLWVSKGIRYQGRNSQIRQWLADGLKEFASFKELNDWIRGPISEEFRLNTHPQPATSEVITDLPAIHEAMNEINQPLYLDEEQLFNRLSPQVLGQDSALKPLCGVVARHTARIKPKHPAVAFAVGPTGVGKTKTGECLADVLSELGSEYGFLRIDCSELQEAHRASMLLGAPPGYVGYDQGSQFVDKLRANPKTVVLFDEIDKAHHSILKAIMNTLDSGRLSSSSSSSTDREIDCRYAIFIFTSNAASQDIITELTTRNAFGNRSVEDEVCRRHLHSGGLLPEIVGRIGKFMVFQPLKAETRAEIMALAITEIGQEYGIKVAYVEPTVIIDILKRVGSQNFGVRPERFLIDELLGGLFAKAAGERVAQPIQVVGPPFGCQEAETSVRQTNDSVQGNDKKEEFQS